HFGFTAVIAADGSAQGHFTCLMAGNANFLGLHLMAVQGPVTSGALDGRSFRGTATVKVLNAFGPGVQSIFRNIPFLVTVTPGGRRPRTPTGAARPHPSTLQPPRTTSRCSGTT